MSFLYFAYGSNLLRQRLLIDNPSAKFVAVGKLENHVLTFSNLGQPVNTSCWLGGVATIKEEQGSSVWGCIWSIDNVHMASLDRQEDVYFAKDVQVISSNQTFTCRTYQLPDKFMGKATDDQTPSDDQRPSPMYLDVIKRGAKQNRLPEEYRAFLERIEHNGQKEDLELYKDIIKDLEDEEGKGTS